LQQASETARIVKVADRIHNLTELPFTSREHQYVYLADTMCLMECLKNYIEQWQFDKLQHFWWQALRQYVQGDSSGKRMANVPASV
jgi:(p)ppGpp synthase/HD superfamily hydrolase